MSEAVNERSVSASGLAVRRGGRLLFDGLSFAVRAGEVLLLRGRNGAGKSSLLLAIGGSLRPEAGRIVFSGLGEDGPEQAMHLVGHAAGIKGQLTVSENLGFWADAYGGDRNGVGAALELVGLGELEELPAGYLSAGQTRRLALARPLVAPRPVWLLDEPTAALDAEGEALVARLIDAHAANGGLVIAATHQDLGLATAAQTLVLGAAA